jgi:NADH:ubiquinone oxidoreductase subunit E
LSKVILVCQNRTCRRQGSAKVLAALQAGAIANVTVKPTGCLGKCGNGPMVVVLPEEIWYSGVQPTEALILSKILG